MRPSLVSDSSTPVTASSGSSPAPINPVATAEGPVRWYEGSEDAWLNAGAASADTATALYQTMFGQGDLAGPEGDQYRDVIEAALAPGADREERTEEAHKAALESGLGMPICFQTSRWLANADVIGMADMPLTWTGIFDPSMDDPGVLPRRQVGRVRNTASK